MAAFEQHANRHERIAAAEFEDFADGDANVGRQHLVVLVLTGTVTARRRDELRLRWDLRLVQCPSDKGEHPSVSLPSLDLGDDVGLKI
jgi:hypothetical protein